MRALGFIAIAIFLQFIPGGKLCLNSELHKEYSNEDSILLS